ncbi:MAG: ADP-ribosylglycohydrolase family protein [Actinomycetia bacterium]|nr:ADP-ribosylglycohydrolase family protein [Actinomycetes bacterium]MCP4228154.1 ADP-ribosylglycohydrolase family protein [Actinomycetes bacterium]
MASTNPSDTELRSRLEGAWSGRISGCQLGKPVELLSMRQGRDALSDYLRMAGAVPVRDYIPLVPDTLVAKLAPMSCRGNFERSEPDDDINYSVLALIMLEAHGADLTTADVARAWLEYLPGGMVFTAERAALVTLLQKASYGFTAGSEPGFDLTECNDNEFNDWIGAQIRADLYGWVCPGRPELAADLARHDAELSHQDEGVYGAMAVAAIGALIPATPDLVAAVSGAMDLLPPGSDCVEAIRVAMDEATNDRGPDELHHLYGHLSPVHTVNNLALVVWGLLQGRDDFSRAIGETVAAGWDTDCNGATVGGLWGLSGRPIPSSWTAPWNRRVGVTLAGAAEASLDDLVERTAIVAERLRIAG